MIHKLNSQQKQAVEYVECPLLIVAGAGTGKTTVITEKIIYLINSGLAKPEEILALTFTDKAAQEMEDRVDNLMGKSNESKLVGYLDLQISTFHAFCQRILENYAIDIGLNNSFKVLSETEAWLLIRDNLYQLDLDYYMPIGNPTKHIHELIRHFSKCKDELISVEDYLEYAQNVKLDKDEVNVNEKDRLTEIANIYHQYNRLLLDNNRLDFGDLIFYVIKLLQKRAKVKKALQNRYKYVMVDEFQDVNHAQYELVKLLSQNSQLTVVGDDDQSIYAFRGASVSNIMRFKDDFPHAKEVVLNENYRSDQQILDLAYESIRHNDPDRLEVKLGIDKRLKSKIKFGLEKDKPAICHIHCPSSENEVSKVMEQILEIKKENKAEWDDFAILIRANSHAEPFLQGLEAAAIPYEFIASSGLYRQPIVMDSINFFKLVDNYHESSAVFRLLKLPFWDFSENDLQKITGTAARKAISYYEAIKRAAELGLSDHGIKICNKLISLIHDGMRRARYEKPSKILYAFLEDSGYLKYLVNKEQEGDGKVIRQIYQIKQFFEYIEKYQTTTADPNVAGFVSHYLSLVESGDEGAMYQPKDTPESVNLLTVHGAKGLEFNYVFLVNLVQDRFPSRRRSEAIEIPLELVKEELPSGDIHEQEERRLFYVALTRARKRLFLFSAANYGGLRDKKLSKFLAELGYEKQSDCAGPKILMDQNKIVPSQEEEKVEFHFELPTSFSFSQIRAYETCPYQYKLNYILKIRSKGNASFSFGKTMHSTMYKFYQRVKDLNQARQDNLFGLPQDESVQSNIQVPALEELLSIYEESWIDEWYKSKMQKQKYHHRGREILKNYYKRHHGGWSIPVALESWFKIKIGDYLIRGSIDRVDKGEDDQSLEIIDYKTGKSKEKLAKQDKEQLLIYKMAAQILPEYRNIAPVGKLTFYYLNDNITASFTGSDKEIDQLRDKIIKIIDKIHKKDFTADPNKFKCKYCDFRDICQFRAV